MPQATNSGLFTQLKSLGQRTPYGVLINSNGWINAQQLLFDIPTTPQRRNLKSNSKQISLMVNEDQIIGEGSMRCAYKAEVKTISSGGLVQIIDYVAKIQYKKCTPNIKSHSDDVKCYHASTLLLNKFKSIVSESNSVSRKFKKVAKTIEVSCTFHFLMCSPI